MEKFRKKESCGDLGVSFLNIPTDKRGSLKIGDENKYNAYASYSEVKALKKGPTPKCHT